MFQLKLNLGEEKEVICLVQLSIIFLGIFFKISISGEVLLKKKKMLEVSASCHHPAAHSKFYPGVFCQLWEQFASLVTRKIHTLLSYIS